MAAPKLFISSSSKEPDILIAKDFASYFKKAGLKTFIACDSILFGGSWSEEITREIKECDYFFVLLSEVSLMSDMVTEEIRKAKELYDKSGRKRPVIFPVRINLPKGYEINYDVAGYLTRIQHRFWYSSTDTQPIVKEIYGIIKNKLGNELTGKPPETDVISYAEIEKVPVPNAPLEIPGGSIALDSPFYITRKGEMALTQRILAEGSLLRIKGPRQFGKTSLLSRIIQLGGNNGLKVIAFNFQQMNSINIQNLDRLLLQLCVIATSKLGIPNRIKEIWDDEYMDVKLKCTLFFEDVIFKETYQPILLAIDEADRVFEYQGVSSEFFGMLRFWHEESKRNQSWKRLRVAISYSTEAYLAITDLNQSPFNVGIDYELQEFTFDEVKLLTEKHGLELTDLQINEMMEQIGGHPFLIRKALYELASGNYTFWDLTEKASKDDGPFGDHLRRHYLNLSHDKIYLEVMRNIIFKNYSKNDLVCNKLRAAGLIKGSTPSFRPGFRIYYDYFKSKME
jgi:hypothetical protein